jgi:hypothetical protein
LNLSAQKKVLGISRGDAVRQSSKRNEPKRLKKSEKDEKKRKSSLSFQPNLAMKRPDFHPAFFHFILTSDYGTTSTCVATKPECCTFT